MVGNKDIEGSAISSFKVQNIHLLAEEWRSMAADYYELGREAEADIYDDCAQMLEAWIDEI